MQSAVDPQIRIEFGRFIKGVGPSAPFTAVRSSAAFFMCFTILSWLLSFAGSSMVRFTAPVYESKSNKFTLDKVSEY